jgi:hypothetical protein
MEKNDVVEKESAARLPKKSKLRYQKKLKNHAGMKVSERQWAKNDERK